MKILHVLQTMDPATGGPPMVVARLAAAQTALGCDVQVASYRAPDAEARIASAVGTIPNIASVKWEYLPPATKSERIFARNANQQLGGLIPQFDLIHLHGVWDPIVKVAGSLAATHKKPYVLTPHGMLDPWSMSQKKLKKQIALALGYRRMLDRAAFLHYLNADEMKLAEKIGLTSPARVLPNGIFLEELDPLPPKGTFRNAHPEFGGAKLIFFLSRLHYKKGLDFLADAFAIVVKEFPDAHLIVAGPDDGAKGAFESQIARLGIASRTHIVGPLYAAQKFAALVDCDCFCLPSRQEGFSLAITEAMACNAPVVISTECHFPEVKEANAGVIAELNAPAIAAGLATVLRDPATAQQMGQNGRELIVSRFTWPKVAARMVEHYKTVVQAKSP
jgi:glycosyltransferase involved in cell wall biosynthesis